MTSQAAERMLPIAKPIAGSRETIPCDVADLIRNKEGNPRPCLANVLFLLRSRPEWLGVLAFNEFSLYVTTAKPAPWHTSAGQNWTDRDDSLGCEWMQQQGVMVNSTVAAEAVQVIARENAYHPVRDYLRRLRWDGTPRIDHWLTTYLGAEASPFTRAVGARWLISAVARIVEPGCQVDHTLLLEGAQGIHKSTALRVLAGDDYFADHISDLGSKDSRVELAGKWILEMSEMDRVRRGELERVKAFLTARSDHFRPPYGRRAEDVPRQCVFAASVNDETSLTDETGNRRFWPVRCGAIDIDGLERDRDALWAEAVILYGQGKPWWLDTAELTRAAAQEQDQRYDCGVWDDIILAWVDNPKHRSDGAVTIDSDREHVTVTDVLVHGIGKDLDKLTQADRNAVARCLVHDGWKRKQSGQAETRGRWFYFRPQVESLNDVTSNHPVTTSSNQMQPDET